MSKNILILNGSPRSKGNTAMLCEAFSAGAQSAGHQVTRSTCTSWTSTAVLAV